MAQEPIQKALVEQILDNMFASIEELEQFDADLIQKLKHLAASGNLKNASQITRAIKAAPGGTE